MDIVLFFFVLSPPSNAFVCPIDQLILLLILVRWISIDEVVFCLLDMYNLIFFFMHIVRPTISCLLMRAF